MSYAGPGVGLDNPDGSLPAQVILWFCKLQKVPLVLQMRLLNCITERENGWPVNGWTLGLVHICFSFTDVMHITYI